MFCLLVEIVQVQGQATSYKSYLKLVFSLFGPSHLIGLWNASPWPAGGDHTQSDMIYKNLMSVWEMSGVCVCLQI